MDGPGEGEPECLASDSWDAGALPMASTAYQVPAPAMTAAVTMISAATGSVSGPRRAPG